MPDRIEFSINANVPGTVDIEAWLRECVDSLRAKGVTGAVGYSWESHGSTTKYLGERPSRPNPGIPEKRDTWWGRR